MKKRHSNINEPESSSHGSVYVRLGMTKGAFIGFCLIVIVIVFGLYRLETLISNNRHLIKKEQALERSNTNNIVEVHQLVVKVEKLTKAGVTAHRALCILRNDFRARITASLAFLQNHPNGIDGLSASDILSSINMERKTVLILAILNCPNS